MNNKNSNKPETSISELIKVVSKLREPDGGCPWDLEQTHHSLIPFVLEEAYEVADAIREGDDDALCDELGDLLLQVILHAQLASEDNRFDFNDISESLHKKLIRRHPHVFTKKGTYSNKDLERSWEEIKNLERPIKETATPLSDWIKYKVKSKPSLAGSMYISEKVARLGFEWHNEEQIWEKFYEEIEELKEAIRRSNIDHAEEELGDVIFTLLNIARWHKLSPEESLVKSNQKFLSRFAYMESALKGSFKNESIEKLKLLWQEAKKYISSKLMDDKETNL